MKKSISILFLTFIFFLIPVSSAAAYPVTFKEEWYKLYTVSYLQTPNDCIDNIYFLENAVKADFCNPQFCDFKVESELQWEKYRYLFQMHLNLKLIEQHLRLGRLYDKKEILFYDAPWNEEYLRNLQVTLSCYESCLYYWQEAKVWYEKANSSKFNFLFVTAKQNWEDERERIYTGELNYESMLNREITRVKKNIAKLESMTKEY